MRTLMVWACLATALGAQNVPQDEGRKEAAGPCEVRVWLMDREKKAVELKEITATMVVADKKGGKKTHAMEAVTPKAGEKTEATPRGETRDVPGTPYVAELVIWKRGEDRGKSDDRSGPYFRTEIPQDALTAESEISVEFMIRGEKKTVAGWTCPPATRSAEWLKVRECLAEVERNLTAHDMTKARVTAGQLMTDLQAALKSASIDSKKGEGCLDACRDLQKHVETGNKDKAFEAYRTCRDKFAELDASFRPKETEKDGK